MLKELTQALSHPNIASGFANATIGSDILLKKEASWTDGGATQLYWLQNLSESCLEGIPKNKSSPRTHSKTCLSNEK